MNDPVKLTRTVTAAGCAAKLDPGILVELLGGVPARQNRNLLVGVDTLDDAGVYQLTEEIALVQTLDFFTPIVDDPFTFGQVAAANALSDVYAMGAAPVTAMNIVCFPSAEMDRKILAEIIRGGLTKIEESGAVLAGGHSIMDKEIKYGLSVTGVVHPGKIWKNSTALPGDVLILTKAIGCGIITTAVKQDKAGGAEAGEAIASMTLLNRQAAEALKGFSVHACTDVTGFSLLGHAVQMAEASGVTLVLHSGEVPLMAGVQVLAGAGIFPGGTARNKKFYAPRIGFGNKTALDEKILFDPQTSGGLLAAIPREQASGALRELKNRGVLRATAVGEVLRKGEKALIVN